MALSFNPHRLRVVSDKENSSRPLQFASTLGTIRESQSTLDPSLGNHTKLNASSVSALGVTKPKPKLAGLGIGKAPSAAGRNGGKKFKPYPRVNSIQRAKDKLNKGTALPLAERIVDGLSALSAKSTYSQTSKVGTQSRRWIKVPLRLPMPVFPLVQLDQGCFPDLAGVPLDYVTDSLRPLLKLFYVHARLYTPAPHLSPFPKPLMMLDATGKKVTRWTAPEMTLAIAPAAKQDPTFESLKARVEGYAPDIVLAVHKSGQGEGPEGPEGTQGKKVDDTIYEQPRMVPANELVLASQCAYWSSLTAWETHTPVPYVYYSKGDKFNSAAGTLRHSRSVSNPHPTLKRLPRPTPSSNDPSTSSEIEVEGEGESSSTQRARRSRSISFPPTPPASIHLNSPEPESEPEPSTAIAIASRSLAVGEASDSEGSEENLTLPVVPIFLPDPAGFITTLLPLLHMPHRSILPTILDIPPAQCVSRESIVDHLSKMDLEDLSKRLKAVHGTWRNLCALGMGDGGVWGQMGLAWGCLVGAMAGKGWKEEMEVDE